MKLFYQHILQSSLFVTAYCTWTDLRTCVGTWGSRNSDLEMPSEYKFCDCLGICCSPISYYVKACEFYIFHNCSTTCFPTCFPPKIQPPSLAMLLQILVVLFNSTCPNSASLLSSNVLFLKVEMWIFIILFFSHLIFCNFLLFSVV